MSNPQIKNLIQLQKKSKARKEQDVFVIEGIKMFQETPLDRLVKAYVSESYYQDIMADNLERQEAILDNIDYELVKDNVFHEISDTITPQGIMAIVKRRHYDLYQFLEHPKAHLIFLEDLRDPGNLGTILRTGEGAGVTGIILSKSCVDIYNPKVIRSTMGSIYRMPHIYVDDIGETINQAKAHGIELYAAHLEGQKDYDQEDYSDSCGILIGNEANGLSDEIAQLATRYIKIPMEGSVESLNAAIAAAILMYEVYRQRRV